MMTMSHPPLFVRSSPILTFERQKFLTICALHPPAPPPPPPPPPRPSGHDLSQRHDGLDCPKNTSYFADFEKLFFPGFLSFRRQLGQKKRFPSKGCVHWKVVLYGEHCLKFEILDRSVRLLADLYTLRGWKLVKTLMLVQNTHPTTTLQNPLHT